MYNQGSGAWCYGTQLPHVKLWHKGVWLELIPLYANGLTTAGIDPGQNRGL